jgi:hypothetical protein
MKVGDLKKILNDTLSVLEDFTDDADLNFQSNTYFVSNARYFLGCRNGYLALDRNMLEDSIEEVWDEDEDDYEDEDEEKEEPSDWPPPRRGGRK